MAGDDEEDVAVRPAGTQSKLYRLAAVVKSGLAAGPLGATRFAERQHGVSGERRVLTDRPQAANLG
jgi:hypothetical protein